MGVSAPDWQQDYDFDIERMGTQERPQWSALPTQHVVFLNEL